MEEVTILFLVLWLEWWNQVVPLKCYNLLWADVLMLHKVCITLVLYSAPLLRCCLLSQNLVCHQVL